MCGVKNIIKFKFGKIFVVNMTELIIIKYRESAYDWWGKR